MTLDCRNFRIALIVFTLTCTAVARQGNTTAQPKPCSEPEQKQLDFWVGEWDLTWPGNNPGETAHGTNSIRRILDGCVVEENFSGGDAMPLRGRSVSIFDVRAGKWKQTWVDNEGGYLDFAGEFRDGERGEKERGRHGVGERSSSPRRITGSPATSTADTRLTPQW